MGVKVNRKHRNYDDSTMSKIGVYAAANVRKGNYFIHGSNKKKFTTQPRRNSLVHPHTFSQQVNGPLSD